MNFNKKKKKTHWKNDTLVGTNSIIYHGGIESIVGGYSGLADPVISINGFQTICFKKNHNSKRKLQNEVKRKLTRKDEIGNTVVYSVI